MTYKKHYKWRKFSILQILLITIYTAGVGFAKDKATTKSTPWQCYQTTVAASSGLLSALTVSNFLDCLQYNGSLSKVAAQWSILKKSHWQLSELSDDDSDEYSFDFATNPMNPHQKHKLSLPLKFYSKDEKSFTSLIFWLEDELFPKALAGFVESKTDNKTALSFESSFYQLVAYMDTPDKANWKKKENSRNHYMGTLVESATFSNFSFESGVSKHPVLNFLITQNFYWPKMRSFFDHYTECKSTRCYFRMEKKIYQALMALLEHPELFEKVHLGTLAGFGLQHVDYPKAQEKLPNVIGCYSKYAYESVPTGDLSFDYSLTGAESKKQRDYTKYGRWGLLGRPIYVEAMNKSKLKKTGIPAQFQGQNAIIRDISDAAVASLKQLKGLNNKAAHTLIKATGGFIETNGYTIDEATEATYDSASFVVADYHRKVANGQIRPGSHFSNLNFFKQTIISKGHSLGKWTRMLSKWNPGVVYYIYAYNYQIAPFKNRGWKSYFERVVHTINNHLEKVTFNNQ
ncbi:MAG: hypothetical protein ISR65_12555 [Bacteriovoracaceae bacterium]|nr:hypothetical protein [Bacteriovoracaceae bacterium]